MRAPLAERTSGVERTFGTDEIIVTKTDLKGVITYANHVFLRVSAFEEDDVIGRPHNLIRHPDMPRCVFALLWERLKSNKELFAYVVNLAGDGAHYWVLAHVTPSVDATGRIVGYHSSRRLPSRGAVREIVAVYAKLCAAEQAEPNQQRAVAAGTQMLEQILADRGQTYDEWVWSLTNESETDR